MPLFFRPLHHCYSQITSADLAALSSISRLSSTDTEALCACHNDTGHDNVQSVNTVVLYACTLQLAGSVHIARSTALWPAHVHLVVLPLFTPTHH